MSKKIVLATFGSLGDVHPFIALGKALQGKNYEVTLAVPASHVVKVSAAGLNAVSIFPDFSDVGLRLNCSDEEVVRRVMNNPDFALREFVLPNLACSYESLITVTQGASAVVGQFLALAAPMVAEKLKIPFIPAWLHPMTFLSADDPPAGPQFRVLAPLPKRPLMRLWNRIWVALIRSELKRRYAPGVNRVRNAVGLSPLMRSPIFDVEQEPPLMLGLYSRVLGECQSDFPSNTHIVGFPVFDSECGNNQAPDANLLRFMDAGPPPLVFTLGSLAVHAPGSFYVESLEAARILGKRAVLLTGREENNPSGGDPFFVCRYAPHSAIFARSAAIIHHGGVGTTGQALAAGKPQLVVPYFGDQWDNGRRIERLGTGRMIGAKDYTAKRAAVLLDALLSDPSVAVNARATGCIVSDENGAITGAATIDAFLTPLIRQDKVTPKKIAS